MFAPLSAACSLSVMPLLLSAGSYSFVGLDASGKTYDTLATPVQRRVLFAGEHTCKVGAGVGASADGNICVLQPGAQLLLQWLHAAGGHSFTQRGWPCLAVAISYLHMNPWLTAQLRTYDAPSLACPVSAVQIDFDSAMVFGLKFHGRRAGAPRHCRWRHADGRA